MKKQNKQHKPVIAKNQTKQDSRVISSETIAKRGNLNGIANDGQNAQLAIQGDCHESACADSRNDEMTAESRNNEVNSPSLAKSQFSCSPSLAEGVRGWVDSHKIPKLAPKLAIVVPCYNEEAVIAHTYKALCQKLDSLISKGAVAKDSFLCFVDDGSVDKTAEILLALKGAKNASLRGARSESERNETIHNNNMDCHESQGDSRNDDKSVDCHDFATAESRNDEVNSPSLAEGDKGGGYQHATNSNDTQFANANSTLPLTPSAREGEQENCDFAREGESPHKLIKLTRNYGHQNALLAGLEFVKDKCDCVVSMDCDLQDDINAIDEMLFKFKNGADVVYGVRKARDNDTAFKKYTALGFYKFMQIMGVKILYNHADFRLLSARACGALLGFREVNLFLRGIVPLVGYKSAVVHYERAARFAGESKYPFGKMLTFALNGITSFSIAPLRMMSVMGVILCTLSFIYGGYAIFIKLFTNSTLEGWTSTILVLLFFGGMQFLGLGIMGEYIGKIYAEVKRRPRYFVDKIL